MVASDEEQGWIEKSLQGDHGAYEALIRKYQQMIHALTYRMTGSFAESEDLAQEAFIQGYQQLRSFRREAKFSSWLYRIAVNLSLNWKKREQRRQQIHDQWSEDANSRAGDGPAGESLSRKVQEALLRLDPKQRASIILTVYDGMNHAEAARALGCSETTVSWRIFAARKKLKKWLQPEAD